MAVAILPAMEPGVPPGVPHDQTQFPPFTILNPLIFFELHCKKPLNPIPPEKTSSFSNFPSSPFQAPAGQFLAKLVSRPACLHQGNKNLLRLILTQAVS